MLFLFISLSWLSDGIFWSIIWNKLKWNKLKHGLWCTIWLFDCHIYIYIYIYPVCISKHMLNHEKPIILLIIPNGENSIIL